MSAQASTAPAPNGRVYDPSCGTGGFLARSPSRHLALALADVDAARARLDRYALATDAPAWQAVDAADALDTARALLAKAVSND